MKLISHNLPEKMIARLKLAKKQTGLSVSEIIRSAIEMKLKELGI